MEVKLQTLLGFGTMEGKKVTIQGVDGEGQEEQASQESWSTGKAGQKDAPRW